MTAMFAQRRRLKAPLSAARHRSHRPRRHRQHRRWHPDRCWWRSDEERGLVRARTGLRRTAIQVTGSTASAPRNSALPWFSCAVRLPEVGRMSPVCASPASKRERYRIIERTNCASASCNAIRADRAIAKRALKQRRVVAAPKRGSRLRAARHAHLDGVLIGPTTCSSSVAAR